MAVANCRRRLGITCNSPEPIRPGSGLLPIVPYRLGADRRGESERCSLLPRCRERLNALGHSTRWGRPLGRGRPVPRPSDPGLGGRAPPRSAEHRRTVVAAAGPQPHAVRPSLAHPVTGRKPASTTTGRLTCLELPRAPNVRCAASGGPKVRTLTSATMPAHWPTRTPHAREKLDARALVFLARQCVQAARTAHDDPTLSQSERAASSERCDARAVQLPGRGQKSRPIPGCGCGSPPRKPVRSSNHFVTGRISAHYSVLNQTSRSLFAESAKPAR